MLVQEITEDATKEIVAKGAHPIATIKDVVEYKHDSCTKQRIDHTYYQEGDECLIEYYIS